MVNTAVATEERSTLGDRNTVPEVGCRSPDISFSIVDLPMPLGPTTEITSQRGIEKWKNHNFKN